MYRAKLKKPNRQPQALLEEEMPISGINPDDFIELYDVSGELLDVQKAYKVNPKGLTPEEELKLLNQYASTMNDPLFVEASFKLLKNGWVAIPQEDIESVVWRKGETTFCFECDENAPLAEKSIPYSWV